MEGVKVLIRSCWVKLLRFFAANRTASVAILSPFPFLFLSLGLTYNKGLWIASGLSYALLVIAATAPQQYARIALLGLMLRSIHKVLDLQRGDRVTIHHIRKGLFIREQYEQLTNYFPYEPGQGRVFSLRKGIVGRCFTLKKVRSTSIPQHHDFKQAFPEEWGYTVSESAHLRQDRRSYFAFPIGEEGDFAKAVLYIDSSEPNRFTSANESEVAEKIKSLFLPMLEEILK